MNFIEVSALFNNDEIVQKIYRSSAKFTPSAIRKCEDRLVAMITRWEDCKAVNVFTRPVGEPIIGNVPEELFTCKAERFK